MHSNFANPVDDRHARGCRYCAHFGRYVAGVRCRIRQILVGLDRRLALSLLGLAILLVFSCGCALATDAQVWGALKEGGKVILLRHTHVIVREGIGRLSPWRSCADEVNLSTRGVEEAEQLGDAFRSHGIAIGEVLASPYCRCMETGRIAFGKAIAVEDLVPPGVVSEQQAALNGRWLFQRISSHRGPSNLVIITHDLNIADIVLEDSVAMGEFFVLEPTGKDFTVIGNIRLFTR